MLLLAEEKPGPYPRPRRLLRRPSSGVFGKYPPPGRRESRVSNPKQQYATDIAKKGGGGGEGRGEGDEKVYNMSKIVLAHWGEKATV